MAKTKDYTVTMEQGQFLLQLARGFKMPEKLGTKTYTTIEKAAAERDVMFLYDYLKRVSPMTRKRGKAHGYMFGPEENWIIKNDKDGNPISGDQVDVNKEVPLPLSDRAVSGALWCLFMAIHPDSPLGRASTDMTNDVLYPLAFRLRRLAALEDELGLRNATSKVWAEDGEREEPPGLQDTPDPVKKLSKEEEADVAASL